MKIEFPKEEENLSPRGAFHVYNHLTDQHLYFLKQQSTCEFFYWKGAVAFFLICLAIFVLRGSGIVSSPLLGVTITGIGCLLIFTRIIQMDFEYGTKAADCLKRAAFIEKKYDYPIRLLRVFEDNKGLSYRGNLLSRFIPMGFVGLGTAFSGVLLALQVGTWLAVIVFFFSIVVLSIGSRLYIRNSMRILLK